MEFDEDAENVIIFGGQLGVSGSKSWFVDFYWEIYGLAEKLDKFSCFHGRVANIYVFFCHFEFLFEQFNFANIFLFFLEFFSIYFILIILKLFLNLF